MSDADNSSDVSVIQLNNFAHSHKVSFPFGGQVLVMDMTPCAAIRIDGKTLYAPGSLSMPHHMNVLMELFRVKEITRYSAALRIEQFRGPE